MKPLLSPFSYGMISRFSFPLLLSLLWCQIGIATASENLTFEAVLGDQTIKIPTNTSEVTPILLAIKITNKSDKLVLVSRYKSAVPTIKISDRRILQARVLSDMTFFPQKNDFIYLAPNRSCFILTDCALALNANGTLTMFGDTHDGGGWDIQDIPNLPGRYELFLSYSASEADLVSIKKEFDPIIPWYGDGQTAFIRLSLGLENDGKHN